MPETPPARDPLWDAHIAPASQQGPPQPPSVAAPQDGSVFNEASRYGWGILLRGECQPHAPRVRRSSSVSSG
jgi:hypothetical protein